MNAPLNRINGHPQKASRPPQSGRLDKAIMSIVLCLIIAILGGAFFRLLAYSGQANPIELLSDSYILRVLRFTILQAFLSTILSLAIAIPVARLFF